MKTVYICGDSFAVADLEYGKHWANLLQNQLQDIATIINLSRVAASNLHIGLQINCALENHADFIIYLATTSMREDVQIRSTALDSQSLLDRYVDFSNPNSLSDLSSITPTVFDTWNSINLFSEEQAKFLTQYFIEYFNMDIAVYKNQLIIEAILHKLQRSNIPFVFDQGGFEHPKFFNAKNEYFKEYAEFFSKYNLWNFVDPGMPLRPYYHITDPAVHQTVADYYSEKILGCI